MLRLRRTPNNFQFYRRCINRNVSSRLAQAENSQYNDKRDGSRDRETIERQEIFTPNVTGFDIQPLEWKMYTKSHIPGILNAYWPRSKSVNPLPYYAAASILPMRTNNYVVSQLIDWSAVPDDPIFQLTFPQPGMIDEKDLNHVMNCIRNNKDRVHLRKEVEKIRAKLNPHPANQKTMNVPRYDGQEMDGMQHKYRETVLFFPAEGQWCHTFCTYCFRWAQFTAVGSPQAFQSYDTVKLTNYLREHKGTTDVLFTGGDPMVMTSKQLQRYIDPLLQDPGLDHLRTIRIGTKSLAYWPYRYVTNDDADDLLRLFEKVTLSGRHLALMAHMSHPRELQSRVAQEAIRRIRMTGAVIRSQAPLIRHVNANPQVWTEMWKSQTSLGIIPYYMFVERDTGARHYFEVPLVEALRIYHEATQRVSGISRTVRGPSMSAAPGKVHVVGEAKIGDERVFVLQFLQARNPQWTGRPFFAKYDVKASWLDHLKPAFGEQKFFYESELNQMQDADNSSGVLFQ
ncbi:putative L-lysine 2,3-aminomutase aq_1632 [Acropora muricata]|uniref:putative L-lysine 2,3-aminomutase aq_1632 n=1 Tax=Acropora muricata TaxID=159855 RepID=UPI0034E5BA18